MSEDEGGGNSEFATVVPPRHARRHYHGDNTRSLFLLSAIVLIIGQSTGANLPLSTTASVMAAVILVIAAGITNPTQRGIHWFNAFVAVIGTILFGTAAVQHFRAGMSVFDSSFAFTEALALLSLVALYFTTKTIRGVHQHHMY